MRLSKRLQKALMEWRMGQGNPDSGSLLPRWRTRAYPQHFDVCMKAVAIGGHTPYKLRRTYASILFSLHVPERYVIREMGHADFATTLMYYSRFIGGDDDTGTAPVLCDGECWADLIVRFESRQCHVITNSVVR
jgi:integrase